MLGIAAGSRSMTPQGVLALRRGGRAEEPGWPNWPPYRWRLGRMALVAAMLGEFAGDKLPQTPSRLAPGSLAGRCGSGALAGAAIGSESGRNGIAVGAILGGAGAIAGSFAGYWARTMAVEKSGLPDTPVAFLEDCAAVGIAAMATERKALTART